MPQCNITDTTIDRLEAITGRNFTRGADKLINEALDRAEGLEPEDDEPRVVPCSGMNEVLNDEKD